MKNDINEKPALSKTSVMQTVWFHEELRIGNYIQDFDKTKIFIVKNVDSSLDYRDIVKPNDSYRCSNHISNLKPIEITKEWLINMGYTQKGSFYRFNNSRFAEILMHNEGIDVCVHSVFLPHIKYIHQLQNLYFSLTGIELTVA